MKIKHNEPYAPLRAKEYPDIGEQLDAIFKMAQALHLQGITLPDVTKEWIKQCEYVKLKYKKN